MNPGTLVIRADANVAIGSGHVMRCLALAQAWQDAGGDAIFALAEIPEGLELRLKAENFGVIRFSAGEGAAGDAFQLATLACQQKASWVVLDGNAFMEHVTLIKEHHHRVLVLDDFGSSQVLRADLILNSNPGIATESYSNCRDGGRLLLGTKYILLRREFSRLKHRATVARRAANVLVSFGGSDPDGLTERVVRAIAGKVEAAVTAVVGHANPRVGQLRGLAAEGVTVLVDPPNFPQLLVDSDLAVIIAGGTLWEALYCGCATLSYSRNPLQQKIISELAERGAVRELGTVAGFLPDAVLGAIRDLTGSGELRQRMREAGQSIVDGAGAARVVREMMETT